jgi:hypothetical protein
MRDAPQLVHTYLFTQCGLRRVLNGSSHNKKLTRKVGFLLRVSCPIQKSPSCFLWGTETHARER